MTTKPERRFTLADAMVLVAAAAVGLALSGEWSRILNQVRDIPGLDPGLFPDLAPLTRRVVLGWPVVAMGTLALVGLRLKGPRPNRRRLFAPPGVAACVVASVMMGLEAVDGASYWVYSMLRHPPTWAGENRLMWMEHAMFKAIPSPSIGFAVVAVWVAMALARRWRPERGWIDRTGLVVGSLWIVLALLRFHLRTNSHLDVP